LTQSLSFDLDNVHFLTFFSSGYLPQAHVLLDSIFERYPDANVIVCTLDEDSKAISAHFPMLNELPFEKVLNADPMLRKVFNERPGASGIFTSVPSIALAAIENIPNGGLLLYLDADTALVNGVEPILESIEGHSVGLFPHNFIRPAAGFLNKYGRFNAGAFAVRKAPGGLSFLNEWRKMCINWCEDRLSGNRYSNQAYLTHLFDASTEEIKCLSDSGGNIAPWNLGFENFSMKDGKPSAGEVPISFFHFHGLTPGDSKWSFGHLRYFRVASQSAIEHLYVPYLKKLVAASHLFGVEIRKSKRFSRKISGRLADTLIQLANVLLRQRASNRRVESVDSMN
jgi:hypothetical protein